MIDDGAIADFVESELPGVAVVYRFGSTASGESRPGSDIDIAFLSDERIDPVRRFEIQERLAACLRRDVDLVDLRGASTVFQMQVISRGTPIRVRDEARRNQFEDYIFSSYARLNEERREILRQIGRDGTVYGG